MRLRLESFHMQCLRKISCVSRWDQQVRSISNDRIKSFLGVPSIMQLIIHQARLRWMGHLVRMPNDRLPKRLPNDRLPKQALFLFLPLNMRAHRFPGLQGGKRLRDALADSLKVADIPLAGWMQLAAEDGGAVWRRKSRLVACWFLPYPPTPDQPLPCRDAELASILSASARCSLCCQRPYCRTGPS